VPRGTAEKQSDFAFSPLAALKAQRLLAKDGSLHETAQYRIPLGKKSARLETVFDRPATAWQKSNSPRLAPEQSRTKEESSMKNIFVGNLDFAATESSIRALFEQYGNVDRVSLITDRDTGRSRGFAFVEMADAGEAERAIAGLNGFDMNGRALNVNEARPKAEGGGGGRPFRGGGGGGGGSQRSGGGGGGGPRQRREPRW
jgi:RNA recognition motif-containing protein